MGRFVEKIVMALLALFLLILHSLLFGGEMAGANYHVEKMKRYIVRNFVQPLKTRDLAVHVGLSPVYCGALFRRAQGVTVAEYLNRIRVAEAAALIDEGAHNITEIAYLCGFSDLSYFSNTFKRIMAMSPGQYKSRAASALLAADAAPSRPGASMKK